MKNTILTSLLLLLFSCFTYSANQDIYFYHLSPKDGLSQMSILSIYQDEFGTMWFGTTGGLDRYNGIAVENIKPSDNEKIRDNTVHFITGDKAGTLFFLTGSDLVKYDIRTASIDVLEVNVESIYFWNDKLWIAKHNQLYTLDSDKNYLESYVTLENFDHRITALLPSPNTMDIYIGTNRGFYKLDENKTLTKLIPEEHISSLFSDSDNNLWVGTQNNGVYVFDKTFKKNHFINVEAENSLSNNQVRAITEDNQGNIWIATFYGLNKFNPKTKEWYTYIHDSEKEYSIKHSSVFSLFNDSQGIMWVGTYFGGVNYSNTHTDSYAFYGANLLMENTTSFPFVGNMIEDKHGNLWICTEGGELNCMNLKTREISKYTLALNSYLFKRFNQKSIWYDENNDLLYIGIHNGGLAIFDINKRKTIKIEDLSTFAHKANIKGITVNHIEFYKGYLYLMTNVGLLKMNMETLGFENVTDNKEVNKSIQWSKSLVFHIDYKNRLWLVTTKGVRSVNLNNNEIKEYVFDENDPLSIGKCEINYIYESKSHDLYFCTMGSGIFKYNETGNNFENFTRDKDGLISDFAYSMAETPSGYLVILHNKGVSFISPNSENVFRTSSNFPINSFNVGNRVYTTRDGEVFIGGVNGIIAMTEDFIHSMNDNYSIYFDKLRVNNATVYPNDATNILNEILPLAKELNLSYTQNNIEIGFATNAYLHTITKNYEYLLEGFDKKWIPANSNSMLYTNLSPGKYILKVREMGNHSNEKALNITINRPLYLSNFAIIIYLIMLFFIFYGLLRFIQWRTRIEESLKMEHIEKERIQNLNKMKLRFFTNVSHEFRTPLTLITSYVDNLLHDQNLTSNTKNKVKKIALNTNHLLDLINDLLDFRKKEQTTLKVKKVDLIAYIIDIYQVFKDYAITKNINYTLTTNLNSLDVYIDPQSFKKVIYNLLSNAFKYTPSGEAIDIQIIQRKTGWVNIEVKDTGIGINEKSLDKIFTRFYQDEHPTNKTNQGTGIGLAFTKEIIDKHKATIEVDSKINEGSIFVVSLKLGNEHFTKEEITESSESDISIAGENNLGNEIASTEVEEDIAVLDELSDDKPTVLVIDDNITIVEAITESLSRYYNILKAYNAKDGYEKVLSEEIDLIICDNIMPEMLGKELCYKIKNNVLVSHIPFILLTAEASESQIAEGYMFGADSYVVKPFKTKVLISICNNLIKSRRLLYDKFRSRSKTPNKDFVLNEHDGFIDKVTEIIKDNLTNPEFDMNKLGEELGYGRSKLYVKIKEVTGMTPNEFTLNVRLTEAVYHLEHSLDKNISQIAFEQGFSSTKYFTKCFKSLYGISPLEWRKRYLGEK